MKIEKGLKFVLELTSIYVEINFQAFGSANTLTIKENNSDRYYFVIDSVPRKTIPNMTQMSHVSIVRRNDDKIYMKVEINIKVFEAYKKHPYIDFKKYQKPIKIELPDIDIDFDKKMDTLIQSVKKCSCDSLKMFNKGCQCGGFESEMKAKDPNYTKKDSMDYFR